MYMIYEKNDVTKDLYSYDQIIGYIENNISTSMTKC